MSADNIVAFQGLYDLGTEIGRVLNTGTSLASFVLNTRDLGAPGAPDYVLLGPGSQVWTLGYAIQITSPVVVPASPLDLLLTFGGSYQVVAPFSFIEAQRIRLPVYSDFGLTPFYFYSGHVRSEASACVWTLFNSTGQNLTLSYQFWGKAT